MLAREQPRARRRDVHGREAPAAVLGGEDADVVDPHPLAARGDRPDPIEEFPQDEHLSGAPLKALERDARAAELDTAAVDRLEPARGDEDRTAPHPHDEAPHGSLGRAGPATASATRPSRSPDGSRTAIPASRETKT